MACGVNKVYNSDTPMRKFALFPLIAAALVAREPLASRIAHNDPAKYHHSPAVHDGAGSLDYMALFGADSLNTNLYFLHRGVIEPKSGIGAHFHNQCEEMFVIFDGEAQFTIDGRTSTLKGPAGALCRMGHSHAIYNATDKPVQWMNINVGRVKGKYDAFNLGDARTNAVLDEVPVFITMRLDKAGNTGYRRALPPEVFGTNWSYVDHVVIHAGATSQKERHEGVEEIYYVMDGAGAAHVNNETAAIKKGDAVPVLFTEMHSFENTGSSDLELMVIGIARTKFALQ